MKKTALYIFLFSAVMLFAADAEKKADDNTNATVSASRLNLRMKPTIKSPKAGSLVRGERVRVTGKDGAWVELAAPASLKLYVSEVYLINGKLTNATNLRAGRSAEAPSFGVLPAGTSLKTTAQADRYGWVQVVPPENIKVYAYSDYITCDSKVEKAPETKENVKPEAEKTPVLPTVATTEEQTDKKAAPAPAKKEVKADKKAAPAPAKKEVKAEEKAAPAPAKKEVKAEELSKKVLEDLEKLGAKPDKESITISGTLIKIPASTSCATNYALIKDNKNQGYVCGKSDDFFSKNEGKELKLTGKSYKIAGWKAFIVVLN